MFLGVHAVNPVNGERIPCFAAPYVLMGYGTGAIMAVPAHDQRDFAFARAHDLPVRVVIQPEDAPSRRRRHDDRGDAARGRDGELRPVRRRGVAGVDRQGASQWLEAEGRGRAAVNFRLRDWLISGSGTGVRRSRSCTAPSTARCRCPTTSCRCCCPTTSTSSPAGSRRWRAIPTWKHVAVPDRAAATADARHRHDGHVRRLELVLLPVLLAGVRGRAVPARGRRPVDAGEPVHRRGRARDPAPAVLPVLHEGAVRHGDDRVHRAVPAADEPGPGDLRRRVDVQDEGQHRRADADRRALGRRHDAADHAVRRAVRGRHRLEADRGRPRPAAGRAPVAGPRVRGGGRRGRRATARSPTRWCA